MSAKKFGTYNGIVRCCSFFRVHECLSIVCIKVSIEPPESHKQGTMVPWHGAMFAVVVTETVWSSGYFDIFMAIFHKVVVVFCPFFTLICLLLTFFSSWSCSETILSLELRGKLLSFDLPIRQSSHNPVVYPLPLRLPVDIFLKLSLQGFVVWKWRFLKKMDESFRRKFEIIFTIAIQSSCMNFS